MTFSLSPSVMVVVSQFTFIRELLLMLPLLIKGVNVAQWEKPAVKSVSMLPAPTG